MLSASQPIALIGAGNLCWSVAPALLQAGYRRVEVFSRSESSARSLGETFGIPWHAGEVAVAEEFTLCVVMVPDDAITQQFATLAKPGRLLAHTSGSQSLIPLEEGMSGVLYPLQTFSRGHSCSLREVPFFIEAGDKKSQSTLWELASALSDRVELMSSEQRKRLHVGAVVLNNFTQHLLTLCSEYAKSAGIKLEVYESLLRETIRKGVSMAPEDAQTGPAKRGDLNTISRHIEEIIKHYPPLVPVYSALTDSLLRRYGAGQVKVTASKEK